MPAHPGPAQLTFRAIQWSIIVTLLVVQHIIGGQTTASIIHRQINHYINT